MPPIRSSARLARTVTLAMVLALLTGLYVPRPILTARASGSVSAQGALGLHVVGQQLVDDAGRPIILRGVNRSGSEYTCMHGLGFFDGPSDLASVRAIAAWGANAIRIPMNEDCWLNINGAPPAYSGAAYQNAIAGYVATVQAAGLVPILELHWTGAGTTRATGQQPMLNRDHSVAFWQQVASAFKNNTGVIFDLHNEPYPDGNRDTAAAWDCWKNGTTATNAASCPGSGFSYQAAGMQEIVNAVRATGATNPIMLGGVQYANALSRWLAYKPQDPTGNLIASWHVYNFNICNSTACYDATAAPVAAAVPLVTGEIGENDCGASMLTTLMNWLDSHNAGYLAWTWDTWGASCTDLSLITDYTGTPTVHGLLYKQHLAIVAASATPTPPASPPSPSPTPIAAPSKPAILVPGSNSETYRATDHSISGLFLDYWNGNGALPQQGYPISEQLTEVSDLDGKAYTVQYFERAVFEYHPENQPPYNVLLSQLGTFQYKKKYPGSQGAPNQQPNTSAGSVLFQQTGHRVGGRFLDYWSSHGGLAQQGYPISDEFTEKSPLDGKDYLVQYFERAVFEYHPENQPPYDVLLSQLGTFQYNAKYVRGK